METSGMRGTLVLATVVLALLGTSASNVPYQLCKEAPFVPANVTLDPNPATVGSIVHFQIDGTADRNMTGGKFDAEVFMVVGRIVFPVYSEQKDLCERTSCPIVEGPVTFTYDKLLPNVTPAGEYKVEIKVYDEDKKLEMCLIVVFTIVKPEAAITEGDTILDLATLKLAWLETEAKLWEGPGGTTADEFDASQVRVVY